jgi:hypothetical protein
MPTVAEVLAESGVLVSEAEFARLLADVLRELGPEPAADPREALSTAEAEALAAVGADLRRRSKRDGDPLAAAAAGYAGLLAAAWSVNDVAARLAVDPSRVRHRLAARTLLGIRRTDGWRLPAWQFGPDGRPLAGLERVLRALPAQVHPLSVAGFFTSPQPELVVDGRAVSPRDWLAGGGDPELPATLARGLATVA